jgi:hypothetical protein
VALACLRVPRARSLGSMRNGSSSQKCLPFNYIETNALRKVFGFSLEDSCHPLRTLPWHSDIMPVGHGIVRISERDLCQSHWLGQGTGTGFEELKVNSSTRVVRRKKEMKPQNT